MTDAGAAGCALESRIAVRFLNDYTTYSKAVMTKRTGTSVQQWLRQQPEVTPVFIATLDVMVAEGHKRDPDLGWGVDLIVDAQDTPDAGFELHACKVAPWIELRGRDEPQFKVVVKVIRQDGRLRVDGAGRVNIPPAHRAARP